MAKRHKARLGATIRKAGRRTQVRPPLSKPPLKKPGAGPGSFNGGQKGNELFENGTVKKQWGDFQTAGVVA